TQTLRDVHVLTGWDPVSIERHLDDPVVFLSTNSRALEEADAVAVTADAAAHARQAASITWRPISFISRSDSTMRGHFPAEVLAMADAAGMPEARILLAPYFGDGGRVTVDDVHYLDRDGGRTPVAETEFARDATFGYRSSNLRDWVAEKYAAAGMPSPAIASLSLEMVRGGGPDAIAEALLALPPGGVAIANAELDRDIEVVALGSLLAEGRDLPLVARTAASYVRARAGRAPAPLLYRRELETDGPGLIVVGSHVETTTRQLEHLLDQLPVAAYEMAVEPLIAGGPEVQAAVGSAAAALDSAIGDGRIGLVSTERVRRAVGLEGGRAISSALVEVVRRMSRRPGWVIAKGGITSYDVATGGLAMRDALVAGQLLPGVPVWIGGEGSRWPGMPLVVFPGNVGDADGLVRAVSILDGA
ncbi:MAG TPA: four-carbon acid sugar kinase family protein, partial [Candidatus Limnocylindria bacterium]|nr:four-carbon acid sugar kinase family protein [Candidatus Limnocylindria bacterium]